MIVAVALAVVPLCCKRSETPPATPVPAAAAEAPASAPPPPQQAVRLPGQKCLGGEPVSTAMPDARPFAQQPRALATVKFQVDPSGRVGRVDVASTTNEGWARAVTEAVRQWRYAPTICDGQPVAVDQELSLPSR